jgi:hypothetical protein
MGGDITTTGSPDLPDPTYESLNEKAEDVENGNLRETGAGESAEVGEGVVLGHIEPEPGPKAKKSLAFKLALTGLAASVFVFQVDVTCLGIALPVS